MDTDQIIPKQFLSGSSGRLRQFLFYDWIRDGEIELEPTRSWSPGELRLRLLPRARPWALEDFGFQAIVAPSFADIFYSNCTKIGRLPAILDEEYCRLVAEAGEARIDVDDETVTAPRASSTSRSSPTSTPALNGLDDIAITLENGAAIDIRVAGGADPAR